MTIIHGADGVNQELFQLDTRWLDPPSSEQSAGPSRSNVRPKDGRVFCSRVAELPPRNNVTQQLIEEELQPNTRLPPTRRVELGILSCRYPHTHADGEDVPENEPGAARGVIGRHDENFLPAAMHHELPERFRFFPGISCTARIGNHGP